MSQPSVGTVAGTMTAISNYYREARYAIAAQEAKAAAGDPVAVEKVKRRRLRQANGIASMHAAKLKQQGTPRDTFAIKLLALKNKLIGLRSDSTRPKDRNWEHALRMLDELIAERGDAP